ncbi:DNA photolyase family protein [Halosquirtibacter laminarini]|uniref:DNA photolyase family protein n=1 Tax=Halosquirtibacter laminarini TaxID=3374600 RepID=A0AC61NHN3_9BACT|nr:DNA photolyase family protein [Prolixibacteraceae bacterium]
MSSFCRVLFVFDRNLRLDNHTLLKRCLENCKDRCCEVLFLYVWDEDYLWPHGVNEKQAAFLREALFSLRDDLNRFDSTLHCVEGDRLHVIRRLVDEGDFRTVFLEQTLSPHESGDFLKIKNAVLEKGGQFISDRGNWLYEPGEILSKKREVLKKYTPFMKQCAARFEQDILEMSTRCFDATNLSWGEMQTVHEVGLGLVPTVLDGKFLSNDYDWSDAMMENYQENRDFPARDPGVSKVSAYLRFGVLSIDQLAISAWTGSRTLWNELIWREFYAHWYYHFPNTAVDNFDVRFDKMSWVHDSVLFQRWAEGKTGYALVDAGMVSLIESGYIHNRVRMVTASFLCKDLHMDWREGEKLFAQHLIDYDPASNVGNWQWVAGCGVDAAPYFRIFNPELQREKFDPHKIYTSRWLSDSYSIDKIIDHQIEKETAMALYREIKKD